MREFYRPRAAESAHLPVQLNTVALQVIDLTHARWDDMPQRARPRHHRAYRPGRRSAGHPRRRKRDPRGPGQSGAERGRRDAERRHPDAAHQVAAGAAAGRERRLYRGLGRRHRRRHERRGAAALHGAVLHHQGRARLRPRPRLGLWRGAPPRRGDRHPQRAGPRHHRLADLPGAGRAGGAGCGDAAAAHPSCARTPAPAAGGRRSAVPEIARRPAGGRRPHGDRDQRRPAGDRRLPRRAAARASPTPPSSPISACPMSTAAASPPP